MLKTVDILERALAACDRLRADPRVLHAEITGSLRRGQAEVGDLDLLLVTRDPWSFERGELPAGEVRKRDAPPPDTARTADVFIATPETYGAVLAFSTGPRLINRRLRERAAQRGFLYDFRSAAHGDFPEIRAERGPFIALYGPDGQVVPTPTEEAFFKLLGVPCVPPPFRAWLAEKL